MSMVRNKKLCKKGERVRRGELYIVYYAKFYHGPLHGYTWLKKIPTKWHLYEKKWHTKKYFFRMLNFFFFYKYTMNDHKANISMVYWSILNKRVHPIRRGVNSFEKKKKKKKKKNGGFEVGEGNDSRCG
jgi:hypothetical protein